MEKHNTLIKEIQNLKNKRNTHFVMLAFFLVCYIILSFLIKLPEEVVVISILKITSLMIAFLIIIEAIAVTIYSFILTKSKYNDKESKEQMNSQMDVINKQLKMQNNNIGK